MEGYQQILNLLPKDNGEKYLQLARDMTKVGGKEGSHSLPDDPGMQDNMSGVHSVIMMTNGCHSEDAYDIVHWRLACDSDIHY